MIDITNLVLVIGENHADDRVYVGDIDFIVKVDIADKHAKQELLVVAPLRDGAVVVFALDAHGIMPLFGIGDLVGFTFDAFIAGHVIGVEFVRVIARHDADFAEHDGLPPDCLVQADGHISASVAWHSDHIFNAGRSDDDCRVIVTAGHFQVAHEHCVGALGFDADCQLPVTAAYVNRWGGEASGKDFRSDVQISVARVKPVACPAGYRSNLVKGG